MKTLALAVMVEKDEGRDITAAEVQAMKQSLQTVLQTRVSPGVTKSSGTDFVNTLKNTFEGLVEGELQSSAGADDDLMAEDNWPAARRMALAGQNEELAIVAFKGSTGQYNVRCGQSA